MSKKPTTGPWKAVCVGDSGGENPVDVYEVTTADEHVRICEHLYAADARLVAAAPELLAELRDLRARFYSACISSGTDACFAEAACARADAAIAKADQA